MSREATDQLYIELGYFTPEEYYVYTAEAACASASSASMSCTVTKVVSTTVALTAESTVQAQGYRTVEIVLSAFSEGTLASSASRQRDYNASVSGQFDIATDFVRTLVGSATADAAFTVTVSGDVQQFVQAEAQLSSSVTVSAEARKIQNYISVSIPSSPRYVLPTINSTSKFDSGAGKVPLDSTSIQPKTNPIWNGTDYKVFDIGYTWISSDLTSWSRNTNNFAGSESPLSGTKWLNDRYVAIDTTGTIYHSTDGLTWTTVTPTYPHTFLNGSPIEFLNGYYYVFGASSGLHRLLRSTDLTTWTLSDTSAFSGTTQYIRPYSANTGSELAFLVYQRDSSSQIDSYLFRVNTSGQLIERSITLNQALSYQPRTLNYANGTYLVDDSLGVTRSSTDSGSTWTTVSGFPSQSSIPYTVNYLNSKWLLHDLSGIWIGNSLGSLTLTYPRSETNELRTDVSGRTANSIFVSTRQDGTVYYSSDTTNWSTVEVADCENLRGYVEYSKGDNSQFSDIKTIDFWLRDNSTGLQYLLYQKSGLSELDVNLNGNTITLRGQNSSGTSKSVAFTLTSPSTTYKHIRFSINGSTVAGYLDGQRQVLVTDFVNPSLSEPLYILSGSASGSDVIIDELLVSGNLLTDTSTTSFTVPSAPYSLTEQQQQNSLLVHFDGDFEHDYTAVRDASAVVTAQANLEASSGVINAGAALLASSGTVTVAGTANKTVSSDLSAEFAQSTVAGTLYDIAGTLFDAVTLTTDAARTRSTQSSLNVQAQLSTDVQRQRPGASDLASEFTQTTDIDRIRLSDNILLSVGNQLSATAERQQRGQAQLSSSTALDSTPYRIIDAAADLNAETAVSMTATKVLSAAADLAATATLDATVDKFIVATAQLASEFAQTAAVTVTRSTDVGLAADFVQTADIARSRETAVLLSIDNQITATATRIQTASSDLSSAVTLDSTAVKTATAASTLAVQSALSTQAAKTVTASIETDAVATVLTAAAKIGDFLIDLSSSFTQSTAAGRIVEYESNTITGIRSDGNSGYGFLASPGNLPAHLTQVDSWSQQLVVSVWYKKDGSESFGNIWQWLNNDQGINTGTSAYRLDFKNTDDVVFTIDQGLFVSNTYCTFGNRLIDDGEYHQYVIRAFKESQFGPIKADLWVDGEYMSTQTSGSGVGVQSNNPAMIRFGYALNTTDDQPNSTQPAAGSYAQFWMGVINPSTDPFDIRSFYDSGVVDLGEDGTAYGALTTPYAYNKLTIPFNGVSFSVLTGDQKLGTEPLSIPDLWARTALTATAESVLVLASTMSVTATVSATVGYLAESDAALSSAFTQSANAVKNTGIVSDLNSEASLSILAGFNQSAEAALSSSSTLTASVGKTGDVTIEMFSVATVTANVDLIPPVRIEADLAAAFAIAANGGYSDELSANLNTTATVSADVTLIPPVRIEADLSTVTTLAVQGTVTAGLSSALNSQATVTATGLQIKPLSADLSSEATVSGQISRLVGFEADLPAVSTQLTVGSLVHIDPFYKYLVEPETRTRLVDPENRVFLVESETRVNMIL